MYHPLCRIKVQAYSNTSGSPVDEKMLLQVRPTGVCTIRICCDILLQLHSDEILGDIREKIMEATVRQTQSLHTHTLSLVC